MKTFSFLTTINKKGKPKPLKIKKRKMSKLINLNDEPTPEDFIKKIDGKDLIIYEDIEGSNIYVQYDPNNKLFTIRPKSLKNEPLNFVDLSIQKYWDKAFSFFHVLPSYITDMLNPKWIFQFTYIPDRKTSNQKYNRLPNNNLILTSIVKSGKHKFNYDEIVEYSNLFDVDPIPLIFNGKLNNKQVEILNLYLKTSEEDLKFIFGDDNFAKFFYNILNPNIENSFLMKDGNYNDNLEKIIIRVSGDDTYTLSILNPLYQRVSDENQTEYSHIFSLIVVSFLEFLQLIDLKTIKVNGLTKDELYVNLISTIFNDYINNMKDDIESWEFVVPNFIKDDKFKINTDLIRNKQTKELIKSSEKIEYIFKVILGSFKKYKKKPIGIMKETTVEFFNKTVDDISKCIENTLSLNKDYIFQKVDLMNFGEYFNLKFDRDGAGKIYTDTDTDTLNNARNQSKKGYDKKK